MCRCDCGKVIERWGATLRSGKKKRSRAKFISGVGLLISGVVLGMKTKTTIFGTPIPGCDIFDFGWLSAAPVIFGAILFGILFMSNTLHLF